MVDTRQHHQIIIPVMARKLIAQAEGLPNGHIIIHATTGQQQLAAQLFCQRRNITMAVKLWVIRAIIALSPRIFVHALVIVARGCLYSLSFSKLFTKKCCNFYKTLLIQ